MRILNGYFEELLHREGSEDDGASMVEYGLLIALIAVVVAIAATTLGTNISSMFSSVANAL